MAGGTGSVLMRSTLKSAFFSSLLLPVTAHYAIYENSKLKLKMLSEVREQSISRKGLKMLPELTDFLIHSEYFLRTAHN